MASNFKGGRDGIAKRDGRDSSALASGQDEGASITARPPLHWRQQDHSGPASRAAGHRERIMVIQVGGLDQQKKKAQRRLKPTSTYRGRRKGDREVRRKPRVHRIGAANIEQKGRRGGHHGNANTHTRVTAWHANKDQSRATERQSQAEVWAMQPSTRQRRRLKRTK